MKSTFDKNAEKFVNLMVEKIESLSMNWQKPWFSKVNSKQNFLPQNLTGRTYSAENGAYPPTQNGLIHPQLLLKWP